MKTLLAITASMLITTGAQAEVHPRDVRESWATEDALYMRDATSTWVAHHTCDLTVSETDQVRVQHQSHRIVRGQRVKITVNQAGRVCRITDVTVHHDQGALTR